MADPICRWRNPYVNTIIELVKALPHEVMTSDRFRTIIEERWPGFLHTPYQLACQVALYYESDDGIYYPRFDHDIDEDEARLYMKNWIHKYYVPNPYTKSMKTLQQPQPFLASIIGYIYEHPDDRELHTVMETIFQEKIGNIDIISNVLNTYTDLIKVDSSGNVELTTKAKDYMKQFIDRNDKKAFFDYFSGSVFDTAHEEVLCNQESLQQIFYGAPGTGKSNTIKREVDEKGLPNVRTTFHPDSDYSTFVGAYKPTSVEMPVMTMIGTKAVPAENPDGTPRMEKKIIYEFVPQAFLKAYTGAWKNQDEPFFLIIEEINRGNCAQIFGDLFQLLDRNDETGLSDYPISPDEDIQKFLTTDKKYGFAALTEEQKAVIPEEVLSGELMILPKNLHIWATMNTSDQSLFPIDSAFKRRWDWKYMPISDGKKGWQIEVKGKRYDWWEFLQMMNDKIGSTTNSEDKKLGYYFCKAKNDVIDAETFVGKVVFYIWNDVFKDFAEEAGDLFKDVEGILSFNKFYTTGMDGKAKVVEEKVELFLQNLGVEQIDALESNSDSDNDDNDNDKVRLTVKFPDGELIAGETKFDSYIAALRKIGLERVEQVAAEKKYQRHGCALISRSEEQGILDTADYSYIQEQGFYIVKGINGRTMRNMLNLLSQRLNLQLEVVYE